MSSTRNNRESTPDVIIDSVQDSGVVPLLEESANSPLTNCHRASARSVNRALPYSRPGSTPRAAGPSSSSRATSRAAGPSTSRAAAPLSPPSESTSSAPPRNVSLLKYLY